MTFRPVIVTLAVFLSTLGFSLLAAPENPEAILRKAFRKPPLQGWIQVHLEGTPAEIGYQHGNLLAKEIAELQKVIALELEHDTKKDWEFFRKAAEDVLWRRTNMGLFLTDEERRNLDVWMKEHPIHPHLIHAKK